MKPGGHVSVGQLVLAFAAGLLIPAAATAAGAVPVGMKNLTFTPTETRLHVGDTVEWTNDDFLVHTATARDGSWDFMLPKGGQARLTVKTPGTFSYYCRLHPNMQGRLVVEP
jgi:plastocyanin